MEMILNISTFISNISNRRVNTDVIIAIQMVRHLATTLKVQCHTKARPKHHT